ncbi:Unknown protein sequence [Pseudomonas savastanoi pv. phaseolicola]|uniref:hypothetical protein n=1 Tax=Pseudomonas savastanoi TaxID=29438 RepID=UPI0006CD7796|nr:hypothetical protein [Pseudomonas savastanoi]KPB42461.1 Unknown protein sequence [Pseudomonas savastanoi pv. phaseolicola]
MRFYAQQVDKKVGIAGYSVILDTTRLADTLEQGSLRLQIARSYDRVAAETSI